MKAIKGDAYIASIWHSICTLKDENILSYDGSTVQTATNRIDQLCNNEWYLASLLATTLG